MNCPTAVDGLGAYVLGALDAEERARFEEHLRGCDSCTAELAEFQAIPPLLARVGPDDLRSTGPAPSTDLFDRLSAAAAPRARARRWVLVAAAALVVLAAGIGLTARDTGTAEQTVTAVAGDVQATVTARGSDDGSALVVSVAGMRPGEYCHLVVLDTDGGRHAAGAWAASAAGDGTWRAWADVDRDDVAGVVLLGDGDRELVRVSL